ncbi:MAG: phosphoribosylformimino-5-aminoimidazole carboxamide ribotide isomerase [Lachnospiraceae bacterium]|nr:phosphoribosylformimino-5-aminoimidazole carboxamide ribotide isomerase [Lachnospiraceae bacterium]MBR5943587.1 phosphoribosylformimino-5-aminoimidazole carboxamide ribotide isomerase [Lachnospiraceae bacterium]
MQFRPCIDIHDGHVKQIVGSTLSDEGAVRENFVSENGAEYYAGLYKELGLKGGHIIILNKVGTPEYEASKEEAVKALKAYPGGLQIGGGIDAENAAAFINAGASHVIVTSYVFKDGLINYENLKKLVCAVGREKIVLDLSCKRTELGYVIATDRWQKMTHIAITEALLEELGAYCDEFLIHAVDVEGKAEGIEKDLTEALAAWDTLPVTYAGGVHSYEDITLLKELGDSKLNVTVGSALDIFGGELKMEEIIKLL